MNFPTVTAQVACVMAILQIILMLRVGASRFGAKIPIPIGDGGNADLERAIRVHGNLIENLPIFLILLGLLEISGVDRMTISILGLAFFIIRLCHAIGMSSKKTAPHPLRAVGAFGTVLCILATAGMLLWRTL